MIDRFGERSRKHLRLGQTGCRQAATLMEVLLSFTVISTLLAGTVTLMALTRKSDLGANRSLLVRQEIRRFADDVRRDVLASFSLSVQDDSLTLASESTDERTVYTVDAVKRSIERTRIDGDQKVVSSDTYQIDADAMVQNESDGSVESVTWSMELRGEANDPIVISVKRRIP